MKRILLYFAMIGLFSLMLVSLSNKTYALATTDPYVSVQILSPDQVTAYPGYETTVQAQVTNNTDQTLTNLVVYITMVDLTKNMTVNLEDYNASVPVVIDSLSAYGTQTVDLPIILVYPDTFHLYVSVANLDTMTIISSDAIETDIMSQASIDSTVVTVISVVSPVAVLLLALGVTVMRKRTLSHS